MKNEYIINIFPIIIIIITFSIMLEIHSEPEKREDKLIKDFRQNSDFAFATLATPAFAMGAVVLGYRLKLLHGDKYDRVCLVTYDVNSTWRQILEQWWIVKEVNEYKPMKHFRRSWTKSRVFDMDEYKKIVYLDTDLMIMQPIDELFSYPQLSCVPDVNPPQICNTGVLVIEPKKGTFDKFDKMARIDQVRMAIGDQSSINAFFGQFNPLPPYFNSPRTTESGLGYLLKTNRSRIIHYVCKKPWKCGREGISYCGCGYPSLNKVWWDAWDEACKDHFCIESWEESKK